MMKETRELFYEDAYLKEFDAEVLSCEEDRKGYAVVLDQTAIYPEGGGQPYDQGTLGNAKVLEVHRKGNVIVHYTDIPLKEVCLLTSQALPG